ncbi:MAG: ABC transporter permease [Selenomonas sp.]|nr:ABC transporter permease [Selenomonas sp.]
MNERITAQISSHRFLALPFTLWAMFFIVLPLFFVLGTGLRSEAGDVTLANLLTVLQSEYLRALGLSVELALISTFICLLLAYPLCLILKAKRDKRGLLVFLLFLLPLWMNSLLTTMAWQTILEKHGLINMFLSYLGLPAVHLINTPAAIIIGMVYNFLPYMVLPLYVSLSRIDESIVEAARDLGANFWQTLRHVLLPLSLPGIVSGCTMVFIPALTTFVISALLGGNKVLLVGNIIEQEFTAAYDWQLGSALSMVLMVFIILNILLEAFTDNGEHRKKGRP